MGTANTGYWYVTSTNSTSGNEYKIQPKFHLITVLEDDLIRDASGFPKVKNIYCYSEVCAIGQDEIEAIMPYVGRNDLCYMKLNCKPGWIVVMYSFDKVLMWALDNVFNK